MRKLLAVVGLVLALSACGGQGAPPAASGSRQVTQLPPAAEASAAAICRAYPVTLRGIAAWLRGPGRTSPRRAEVIATTDRVNVTLDPACHGAVTEAALATVSSAFSDLVGAQAVTVGGAP